MNLLFLSVISTVLCLIVVVALKYLPLLRLISGHAYVLSKRREHFSILEVLDLFKNVRPFPVSCQKGWKIDSCAQGHRVWFNFLTFPHNINAPSIKVYAVFGLVRSSAQALLQVLKDISQSCEWKPGVISASHTHNLMSHEVPSTVRGLPSMPVQVDCVKEEKLSQLGSKFALQYQDPWVHENVVPTTSVEFKRFWHREDNGVCWLLQMNEKLQTCEFYLIQPVQDVERCLVSVVTWCQHNSLSSKESGSVLFSSLQEYIYLRRVKKTPLNTISLPQDLSESEADSSDSSQRHESFSRDKPLFHKFKKFILDRKSSNSSDSSNRSKSTEFARYSSILKYKSRRETSQDNRANATGTVPGSLASGEFCPLVTSENINDPNVLNKGQRGLQRSMSDGRALRQSRLMNRQLEQNNDGSQADEEEFDEDVEEDDDDNDDADMDTWDEERDGQQPSQLNIAAPVSEKEIEVARYKTLSNQCAAELMAEAVRASNIDLELPAEQQAESSGGWLFSSFEKNIVVLKKNQLNGSAAQSYIGKGFVLAPPRTVWDAVRNPRTRFTYDDTLKKVDILETIDNTLKIVYFYHESQQFLMKESCDMCVLQGERREGDKYILTYSSVDHDNCPVNTNITRARFHPSGWIIEPAKQDNKVYSIVTYLMQLDFGPSRDNSDNFPFNEMISRYPLSIADLQQYLKPAVQMLRRKSLT